MVSADRWRNTVPCLVVHMRTGWTQIVSDKALVTSWLFSGGCSSRRLYGGCSAGAFSKAVRRLFSTNSFESSTWAVQHEVRVKLCITGCSARLLLVLVHPPVVDISARRRRPISPSQARRLANKPEPQVEMEKRERWPTELCAIPMMRQHKDGTRPNS